jgi:diguanylate cyclase (GGDEF)-like protein
VLNNQLQALIDRFLPDDLLHRGTWEQLLRGRALAGVLLLSLLHTIAMVPPMLTLAPEGRDFTLVAGGLGVLTVVVIPCFLHALRRGHSLMLLANLFVGYSGSILLGMTLATGGFPASPLLLFLMIHPVMALLTAGRRSGLIWLVLMVLSMLILQRLDVVALVPQSPATVVRRMAESTWVVITLALFGMVFYYDVINRGLAARITSERDQADFAAAHDVLTGLLNRGAFNQRLSALLERSRSDDRPFALLMIDLDGFKGVNDNHGHHTGDRLLQIMAQRLAGSVREQDAVARIGGDEFAVAMEGVSPGPVLERVVSQLLSALSQPARCEGIEVAISASIGVALWPMDGDDEEALLHSADRAMYAAKRRGRNRAVYADELAHG